MKQDFIYLMQDVRWVDDQCSLVLNVNVVVLLCVSRPLLGHPEAPLRGTTQSDRWLSEEEEEEENKKEGEAVYAQGL